MHDCAEPYREADRARRFIATIETLPSTDAASWRAFTRGVAEMGQDEVYDPLEAGTEALWNNLFGVTSWEYRD